MSETVFDPGAQLERTALSWQRTLLALAVASLASARGLGPVLGPVSWAIAALGLGVTIGAFIVTRRRYQLAHRHLANVDAQSLPGGALLIISTAGVALVAGLAALAFVLSS